LKDRGSAWPVRLHVLELADELDLSADQLETARSLRADVLESARALGARIVAAEHELDALFGEPAVDPHRLEAAVHEIARLRAELRMVHLRAHLDMNEALTREQAAHYHALRHGPEARAPHQH
jgi:Spy/CpxP family protein refolding chaperone